MVVKAVFNYRPDGHLRFGKQLLHGVGEQVRGGVPQDLDALPVAFSDDRHISVTVDSMRGVDELAIHSACERGTRQSGPDRLGDLGYGDRARKALYRAVGKANVR